jgi:hypothetical protein
MKATEWIHTLDTDTCPVFSSYAFMMDCADFQKKVPASMAKLALLLYQDANELFDQLYVEKTGLAPNAYFCERAYRRVSISLDHIDDLREELGEMKTRWLAIKDQFHGFSQRFLEIEFAA